MDCWLLSCPPKACVLWGKGELLSLLGVLGRHTCYISIFLSRRTKEIETTIG